MFKTFDHLNLKNCLGFRYLCFGFPCFARRFRLFPVRSPLLRESLTIYFPLLTKMFQFSRYPSTPPHGGGLPIFKSARFLNSDTPGSKLVWQLPEAYRNLLRPSSATSPKASTIYSCIRLGSTSRDGLN